MNLGTLRLTHRFDKVNKIWDMETQRTLTGGCERSPHPFWPAAPRLKVVQAWLGSPPAPSSVAFLLRVQLPPLPVVPQHLTVPETKRCLFIWHSSLGTPRCRYFLRLHVSNLTCEVVTICPLRQERHWLLRVSTHLFFFCLLLEVWRSPHW